MKKVTVIAEVNLSTDTLTCSIFDGPSSDNKLVAKVWATVSSHEILDIEFFRAPISAAVMAAIFEKISNYQPETF